MGLKPFGFKNIKNLVIEPHNLQELLEGVVKPIN
jgi:hypothetical protein